jgi:tetratricopeptide (TPR) repeat protein
LASTFEGIPSKRIADEGQAHSKVKLALRESERLTMRWIQDRRLQSVEWNAPVFILAISLASGVVLPVLASGEADSGHEKTGSAMRQNAQRSRNTKGKGDWRESSDYHFAMAQAYVSDGNTDRAIEEYKLALVHDPDAAIIYVRLAAEYVKKGMLTAALETAQNAVAKNPKGIKANDARMILGGIYSTLRERQKAIEQYEAILASDPKNEEAAVFKAQALVESSKIKEAVEHLRRFVKGNSESAVAWYYLGRAHQILSQKREAETAYLRARELRPDFTQASLTLGMFYEESNQPKRAIEVYSRVFEDSQNSIAANRLATLLLKAERFKDAIPYLKAVELADPEDLNAKVKLGLLYMETKKFDLAIAQFQSVLAKAPDSDRIRYYLGNLYEEMKKPQAAIEQFKMIPPSSKNYGDAILHTGFLLRQENRADEAKALLMEAIEKQPRLPQLYLFHASLEDEARDQSKAMKILEKAVSVFPENEKIRFYLGSLYGRSGREEQGIEQMEALLKLNPDHVEALNFLGYAWTTKGIRLEDAERVLRRAIALKPENGYIKDSWGWHLFVRGRVGEAIVQLEAAAKLKPNEATILEHLGDAYMRSNFRERAADHYKKAIQVAEDESAKSKLKEKLESVFKALAAIEGGSEERPKGSEASTKARKPASEK